MLNYPVPKPKHQNPNAKPVPKTRSNQHSKERSDLPGPGPRIHPFPGPPRGTPFQRLLLKVEDGLAMTGECIGVEGTEDPTVVLTKPSEKMPARELVERLKGEAAGGIVMTYGVSLDRLLISRAIPGAAIDEALTMKCVYDMAKRELPEAPTFAPRQMATHLGIKTDDVPPTLRDAMMTARIFERLAERHQPEPENY